MLYIHVKKPDKLLRSIDYWFNHAKKNEWFNDSFVKEIIMGIDKTKAVRDQYLESPVFGAMSPDRLSTGCKAVICMYVQDRPVYATCCGDNCAEWILQVASRKDLYIYLKHFMCFPNVDFDACFVDSDVITHTRDDFYIEFSRLRNVGVAKGYPVPMLEA